MSRIVLVMSVSLDGYIEGPGRDIGWHLVDEELHAHMNEVLGAMGAFLSGRVTWELMADFWPTADSDPALPPVMAEFARIWVDMPKVVYSRTLDSADWNTTVVHEVVAEEVGRLRDGSASDLALGGADLAAAFMRQDLIDEFRIYVHPVAIGSGKPLFPVPGERIDLDLVETHRFGNGVVLLRYRRPGR